MPLQFPIVVGFSDCVCLYGGVGGGRGVMFDDRFVYGNKLILCFDPIDVCCF